MQDEDALVSPSCSNVPLAYTISESEGTTTPTTQASSLFEIPAEFGCDQPEESKNEQAAATTTISITTDIVISPVKFREE